MLAEDSIDDLMSTSEQIELVPGIGPVYFGVDGAVQFE